MVEAEHDVAAKPAATERELALEKKIGSRTIFLILVSMVALVELLILVRPLLK